MDIVKSNCNPQSESKTCSFLWTIEDYPNPFFGGPTCKSPTFSAIDDDFAWCLECKLRCFAKRCSFSFTLLADYYGHLERYSPVSGDVEISVLIPHFGKMITRTSSFRLECGQKPENCNFGSFGRASSLPDLKDWADENKLTIRCNVQYYKKTEIFDYVSTFPKVVDVFDSKLSLDLDQILNRGHHSDLTISVKGKNYPVHKAIVTFRSSVFDTMLSTTNDLAQQGNEQNCISITDMEQETFEKMLYYIYTGKVKNLRESAIDLLPAADKYDLLELKKMCEEVLFVILSIHNVAKILKVAELHNAEELREHALRFIKSNYKKFPNIRNTELWKNTLTTCHRRLMEDLFVLFFET